ncbi:hypothetical protein EMCRGX_G026297 [Ephydatia muelleri]
MYVPLQGRSTSCPVLDAFFSCMRECKDTQESPEFDYVRYILLAAPYRQEFIFSAYSVPCTSPQCLVWFQLWSSMAKQVLKSNVSGFISKFLTVISISLLACQCLDVKVQVPCHLHLTQTGSLVYKANWSESETELQQQFDRSS